MCSPQKLGSRSALFAWGLSLLSGAAWAPVAFGHVVDENHAIGLDTSSYLYSGPSTRESLYPSLNLSYSGETAGPVFEAVGSAKVQFAYRPNGGSHPVFEFPEAYLTTRSKTPEELDDLDMTDGEDVSGKTSTTSTRLAFGRKLENWNELDRRWQLGIWGPRFRWDYISPETVGLLGGFLNIQGPKLKFVAFASPFFIPERGAPITVENGAVTSNSPWFIPPPSKVRWLKQATRVQYDVAIPPAQKIVSHGGAAAMLRVGAEEGYWASVAYAYKPMNQLLLAYDVGLALPEEDQNFAQVTIYPRVVYHHLSSLEFGFKGRDFSASLSGLSDRPVRDVTDPAWVTQEVSPALALSPAVDFSMGGRPEDPTRLQISYLRVFGGNASDGGSIAFGQGSVFDTRYPFQNAAKVGLDGSLSGIGLSRFHGALSFLQDFDHSGQILSSELKFFPKRNWIVSVGADILGSDSSSDSSNAGSDFISRYQDHDRVHAGVSYVF